MGASSLRDLSKRARSKENIVATTYGLSSANNFLLYGSTNGKSTLSLTQLEGDDSPILVVSAAGGSSYLADRYPNAIFRTAVNLQELETIIKDLEVNYKILNAIQGYVESEDKLLKFRDQAFIPTYYNGNVEEGKEDFEYLISLARNSEFIYSRIVLEECDVLSSMIQDKVELQFGTDVLGEDKSVRGKDWSALSSELVSTYSRWLRMPCITILATGDKQPGEREGLKQVIPALCTGGAQRQLSSMIGNVLNIGNDEKGYYIQVKPDAKAFTRTKFYKLQTDFDAIPVKLDITNNPELFWQFLKDNSEGKYNLKK